MRFLFAPWGNPKNWGKVTYLYDGERESSITPLTLLQRIVSPDKLVIFGLDTLAEDGSSYEEVASDAKEKLNEYAKGCRLKDFEIAVSPGVGRFSNGTFTGSMLDYYYYVSEKIIEFILGNWETDGELEVHLDLTHGINYMTVLTYRALKEVLEVAALFTRVKFTVYNADPYVKDISDELSINVVEEGSISPRPFRSALRDRKLLKVRGPDEGVRERLSRELGSLKGIHCGEISAFIGSIYNGLPLALYTFYPDKEEFEENIRFILEKYREYIHVGRHNAIEVTRGLEFTESFRVYIFSFLMAKLLEKTGVISGRKTEVSLDEVGDLNNKFFNYDARLNIRIDNDLHNLNKDLECKAAREWEVYNSILGRSMGEPDRRNFLAHSGFERNLVEVRKDVHRGILLRYREDKVGTIEKICKDGLNAAIR
ncbi:MAG: CRISPR-associated CARF protein Csx1 [Candidatus Bathyarchaeia archaeon]